MDSLSFSSFITLHFSAFGHSLTPLCSTTAQDLLCSSTLSRCLLSSSDPSFHKNKHHEGDPGSLGSRVLLNGPPNDILSVRASTSKFYLVNTKILLFERNQRQLTGICRLAACKGGLGRGKFGRIQIGIILVTTTLSCSALISPWPKLSPALGAYQYCL